LVIKLAQINSINSDSANKDEIQQLKSDLEDLIKLTEGELLIINFNIQKKF
jgi:hypothetical protein